MFRLFIFIGIVFGLFSSHAEAKTIRYEFDVVESHIGFLDLLKYSPYLVSYPDGSTHVPQTVAPWQLGEREYYIRKYHPLAIIYGLGGKVVLDLNILTESATHGSGSQTGSISCVSGFLCLLEPSSFNVLTNNDLTLTFTTLATRQYGTLFFEIHGNLIEWYPLALPHMSGFVPCDFEPNCYIDYFREHAYFSIENLKRTEVVPTPLPATAWLLVLALFALGLNERRRPS